MRSIGKKNMTLVKQTTLNVLKKRTDIFFDTNFQGIDQEIIDLLPSELWDTWEMADSQIRNLINDTISERN